MFHGLTKELCYQAFHHVRPVIAHSATNGFANKYAGCMVVLDPQVLYVPGLSNVSLSEGEMESLVLWSDVIGDEQYDLEKYQLLARKKAMVSWLTGLPSHRVQQEYPYLLTPGMTKWGGSAVDGPGPMRLIVAFSGVQWNIDQMFAEMMISAIKALCLEDMREIMDSNEPLIGQPSGR